MSETKFFHGIIHLNKTRKITYKLSQVEMQKKEK